MKIAAWVVVIIGWILYGLMLIGPFLNPHPHDPMDDFKHFLHPNKADWTMIPITILFVVVWYFCWEFIKESKKMKKHKITIQESDLSKLDNDIASAGAPEINHKEMAKIMEMADEIVIDPESVEILRKEGMTPENLIEELTSKCKDKSPQ